MLIRPTNSHDNQDLDQDLNQDLDQDLDRDREALWAMLEPVIRAGEVFALPRNMSRAAALAYWFSPPHTVFMAEDAGAILGSYFIQPNQPGPGSHVANCGYLTAPWATGRGIAGAMCAHSLHFARQAGYRAMQFNLVVSTNLAAVHLWTKHGFQTLARLPAAFLHPTHGYVDALVLWQSLSPHTPSGPQPATVPDTLQNS